MIIFDENKIKNESQNYVKWKCCNCGYKWKGLSPHARSKRPTCSSCGSWNVRVDNWLIDKNKWEGIKKKVIERDDFRCQRCGIKVNLDEARIHHTSYYDYYNSNFLITLCIFCHHHKHKSFSEKISLWLANKDFPQNFLTDEKLKKRFQLKVLYICILILIFAILFLVFIKLFMLFK